MNDEKIIALFKERDETAITETRKKYGASLRGIAGRICRSDADAEECESDAYLAAWNNIPPEDPGDHLFAYLAKIARASAVSLVRKKTTRKRGGDAAELAEDLISAEDVTEKEVFGRLMERAVSDFLRSIPEEKRNIFLRKYWFMDSVSDIAKRFDVSEGKVKTVLFRTRNDLKRYLKKEGFEV